MTKIKADLSGPHPVVTIDDREIAVSKVYLSQEAGNFPQAMLVVDAEHIEVITANADVSVQSSQADIRKFLLSLDPKEIEGLVLSTTSYADNVIAGVIAVLRKMADGTSGP